MEDQKVLTVDEVAKILGVSKATVWGWCRSGKIPAYRFPHTRRWFIDKKEFEATQKNLRKYNAYQE